MAETEMLENRTFDEIEVGTSASLSRTLTKDDIDLFAAVSGDVNPAHLDEAYAKESMFKRVIAHGMWSGALISNVLGTRLPGAGTIYLGQNLRFRAPVGVGDTITVTVTAKEKRPERRIVLFDCEVVNQDGRTILTGEAEVIAPAEKIRTEALPLPEVHIRRHDKYARLIQATRDIPAIPCAVAHPCDESSLKGAIDAAEAGMIVPLLVGPERRIRGLAEEHAIDLRPFAVIDAPHSHAAAAKAVALVREGRAELLMKGSLHSDELLAEVVAKETGLRTERRISHVFIMDVPSYPDPLFITDAAVNIFPDLETKRDIVQNAIDLHLGLGLGEPRVAIVSAVETVTPKIPGTIDAAALCKMADRGQITGGLLDGPLALDNAISPEAARIKGIRSAVAGRAQILLVPDLEAGNMLAKNLTFLTGADAAGLVLGARVPVILTSRADNVRTRMASTAVAALYAHHLRSARPVKA
jgi:phosphotransacetylase/acyl dehydratase